MPQKYSIYKLQHLDSLTITNSRPGKDGSPGWEQVASQEAGIRKEESKLKLTEQNFSPHCFWFVFLFQSSGLSPVKVLSPTSALPSYGSYMFCLSCWQASSISPHHKPPAYWDLFLQDTVDLFSIWNLCLLLTDTELHLYRTSSSLMLSKDDYFRENS